MRPGFPAGAGYASVRVMGNPLDTRITDAASGAARRPGDPAGSSNPAVPDAVGARLPAVPRPMDRPATRADLDRAVVLLERDLRVRERRMWLWQLAIAAALFFALRRSG